MPIGPITIEDPTFYALKSGASNTRDVAEVTPFGLKHDRDWIIIDAKTSEPITQRNAPLVSQLWLRPTYGGGGALINISSSFLDEIYFPYPNLANAPQREFKIFDATARGIDAGDEVARYISIALSRKCRLLYQGGLYRQVDQRYADGHQTRFSVLVASMASLNALNEALIANGSKAVRMSRFRPNIILSGTAPWQEDVMRVIQVGDGPDRVELELVKPCARCIVTTIDPETGMRKNMRGSGQTLTKLRNEPLQTLAQLRFAQGLGAIFGMNAVVRKPGTIKEGDEVTILEQQPVHPALLATAKQHGGMALG